MRRTNRKKKSTNRLVITLALAALLVAGFALGRMSGPRDGASDHESHAAATQHAHGGGGAAASQATTYYCPMHPDQRATQPDEKCPICSMDMVEMPTDAGQSDDDAPALELTERSKALMNIQVLPVERRAVTASIHVVGQLEADETRLRDVVVRASSYIEDLHGDYKWKTVEKGEVLAEAYSPAVKAAARELLLIDQGGGQQTKSASLEAAKGKLRRLGVSRDQIARILESGTVPDTYEIRSPIKGHIMYLHGKEGVWLGEGDRLAQVMDPSPLWVQLEAYERDLMWLREGLSVDLEIEAFPGETVAGEVAFIDPHVDPDTRTARVRIEVPNPNNRLKPGMFVRGEIAVQMEGEAMHRAVAGSQGSPEPGEKPLVIPVSAPLRTGQDAIVYVKDPDSQQPRFEGREIVLGPRAGDYYLVRKGLEEGELVVTNGAFRIDSELQIRGRPSMMSPPGERPDAPHHHVSGAFREQVDQVLDHYLGVTDALAADDGEGAREAASAYRKHLASVEGNELDASTEALWQKLKRRQRDALTAMANADEIGAARRSLPPLTRAVGEMVRSLGGAESGPVYRMHCPMAFDNEGANWLQTEKALRNPYMGQSMLRCGSIQNTINQ